MKLLLTKVEPIGMTHCSATINPDGEGHYSFGMMWADKYAKNPHAKAFQDHRRQTLRLAIGEAAQRLGLSASQLCALENGEYDCDWELAVEMLEYKEMVQ